MQNQDIFTNLFNICYSRCIDADSGVPIDDDEKLIVEILKVADEHGIAYEYDECQLNIVFTIIGSSQDEFVVVGSQLNSLPIALATLIQICKVSVVSLFSIKF